MTSFPFLPYDLSPHIHFIRIYNSNKSRLYMPCSLTSYITACILYEEITLFLKCFLSCIIPKIYMTFSYMCSLYYTQGSHDIFIHVHLVFRSQLHYPLLTSSHHPDPFSLPNLSNFMSFIIYLFIGLFGLVVGPNEFIYGHL